MVSKVKRIKQEEVKRRIWLHLYDIVDNKSIEDWVDIVYGQGLPIRIEALSDYKLNKLDVMIDIIQNQIKVKVLKWENVCHVNVGWLMLVLDNYTALFVLRYMPRYKCDLCHRSIARAHSAKKYNICGRCLRISRAKK